jgi:hypothetical protein
MSPLHFLSNSLSDPTFDAYLKDTRRYSDYCEVRDRLLPALVDAIAALPQQINYRFSCVNHFEGQHPTLRVKCPVGFVPDVIEIEFPPHHDTFQIKQAAQALKVQGREKLENHLRVILMMGLAHWHPT